MLNKDSIGKLGASNVAVTASVAATVATLCAGAAYATTIANRSATTAGLSADAIARVAATVTTALGDITVTLGATYDANDEVTFTLSGGQFGPDDAGAFACFGASGFTPVTSRSGTNTRTFRLNSGSVVSDTRCTLNGVSVVDTSVSSTAGSTVTLQASGLKSSTASAFNTGNAAGTIATVVNEWSVAVTTPFDASVDAKKNNKVFTSGATADRFLVTVTNANTLNNLAAAGSTNALVVNLSGDFSFLANGTETANATGNTLVFGGENSAAAAGTGTATLTALGSGSSVTGLRLTIDGSSNLPGNGSSATYGVDVVGADSATSNSITAQSFATNASYSLAFASGAAKTGSSLNAGTWGASGAVIFVPYMPIGSTITNVLYFTNNSSSTGNALMTIRGEAGGTSVCTTTATTALKSNGVTNLSNDFTSLVATCQAAGRIATTDKVFVTISSTVPVANSEVYSGFTVGGTSRVAVVNSSSGYKGNSAGGNIQNVGQGNADNR